MLIQCTYKSAV